MDFDHLIPRRGSFASKWDAAQAYAPEFPDDGLPMWVADSDFAAPDCVRAVVSQAAEHGAFGYGFDRAGLQDAVAWWMQTRHAWTIDPDWVVSTQGLGHALAMIINFWSEPGEGIAYFSPVYHEFRFKTERAGRRPVPLPLRRTRDDYILDLDDAAARLTGDERVLIWCSPQNPTGRVWTPDELRAVAAFARAHDLLLVSDEVHHDLVLPGRRFIPMDVVAPDARDILIILTAASKTFNLAGMRVGQMIMPDPTIRARIKSHLDAFNFDINTLGAAMVKAAYSPDGAAWADAQLLYIAENHRVFAEGLDAIPGVRVHPAQSTYLAWADFSGTGMAQTEIDARIITQAGVLPQRGPDFGPGGELCHRFNLATPRSVVTEAIDRLQRAFADLQ